MTAKGIKCHLIAQLTPINKCCNDAYDQIGQYKKT